MGAIDESLFNAISTDSDSASSVISKLRDAFEMFFDYCITSVSSSSKVSVPNAGEYVKETLLLLRLIVSNCKVNTFVDPCDNKTIFYDVMLLRIIWISNSEE